MTRIRGERGSVSAEVVIITPVAIALLCLVALVGRSTNATEQMDEAARDAARAASLQRNTPAAIDAAHRSARSSLDQGGVTCASSDVAVDTSAFHPGGQVTVTVRCDIPLSDLGLIGLAGTRTVTATAVSVIDTYRGLP